MHRNLKGLDQRPAPFVLSADTAILGIVFPAGSVVGRDESERLWRCRLGRPGEILGVPCAADEISFFPSGALATCRLACDHTVSGVTCRGGELLLLHPGGVLFRGVVARDVRIGRFSWRMGDEISLHENGMVASARLREDTEIGEVGFRGGTRVWLNDQGVPLAGSLREAETVFGETIRVLGVRR